MAKQKRDPEYINLTNLEFHGPIKPCAFQKKPAIFENVSKHKELLGVYI
jgi:hypothetical protein